MKIYSRNSGFTLVEALVASVIGAFVAAVAVGTLRSISTSAEMVDTNVNAAAEVRFAADTIARDLMNFYRDSDGGQMRFFGASEGSTVRTFSYLTFYTVGRAKARYDYPEGDVYEVEYSLVRDDQDSVLVRRWWPNPDKETEPGGIVAVIAENIDVFALSFYDGQQWLSEWPEEPEAVPYLVEVLIGAATDAAEPITESFVVNFPRSTWQQDDSRDNDQGNDNSREGEQSRR
jgi:type II secretion system protein J